MRKENMKKQELAEGLALLIEADLVNAPNFKGEAGKRKEKLWMLFFKDILFDDFVFAIVLYIRNNTFFPTVNQILELIPEQEQYPPSYEIYDIFKNADYKEIHPLIKKAFKKRGIDRYTLEGLGTMVIQKNILPAVTKIYEKLVAKEKKIDEVLQIKKIIQRQMLIENK